MTVPMQLVTALVALIVVAAAAPAQGQTCDRSPLVIRNVAVWTPSGITPARDVLMQDGRVTSIELGGGPTQKGARVIDGAGQTLLPGLVDAHVHFTIPGGLPERRDASELTARQLITSGVTSGRLHLATLEEAVALKARAANPCTAIPRLQVGGPGLSGALEKDFSAFQGARSAVEGIAKVQSFAAAGVDWIAIHDTHLFPPGVLMAVAGAARKAGLRLMAEGSLPEEIAAALSIRPDTLDYIDRTTEPGYSKDLLDRIRSAKDIVIVPTIGVPFRAAEYTRAPARIDDATNVRLLAGEDAEFVIANAKKDLVSDATAGVLAFAPTMAQKLRELRALGLPVAVGSDAGSTMHWQANAIWWEMEAWRAAGVAPRDVLIAATEHGARVLSWPDVGHLRPGARADFVLYRGNVEEGPFDVARVSAVGKDGVVFAPF